MSTTSPVTTGRLGINYERQFSDVAAALRTDNIRMKEKLRQLSADLAVWREENNIVSSPGLDDLAARIFLLRASLAADTHLLAHLQKISTTEIGKGRL